jgi:hypothetical protein
MSHRQFARPVTIFTEGRIRSSRLPPTSRTVRQEVVEVKVYNRGVRTFSSTD